MALERLGRAGAAIGALFVCVVLAVAAVAANSFIGTDTQRVGGGGRVAGARVVSHAIQYREHNGHRAAALKSMFRTEQPHLLAPDVDLDNHVSLMHHWTSLRMQAKAHEVQARLYGSIMPLGAYFITLMLGTPSQPINTNVDTGSSVLAVPGAECVNKICGDARTRKYSLNMSKTGRVVPCTDKRCNRCNMDAENNGTCSFSLSYGDGSFFRGFLVDDVIEAAPDLRTTSRFGVATALSPAPVVPIDGLVGLAFKDMSCQPTCTHPFFDDLLDQGVIKDDVFSMCLEHRGGGTLTLGGLDPTITQHHLSIDWVPLNLSTPRTFYTVKLTNTMHIGWKKHVFPHDLQYGIVDSGTTLLLMTQRVFDTIKHEIVSDPRLCKAVRGLCKERLASSPGHSPASGTGSGGSTSGSGSGSSSGSTQTESWFCPFCCVFGLTYEEVIELPPISFDLAKGKHSSYSLKVPPEVYMMGTPLVNMNGAFLEPKDSLKPDSQGNVGYCVGLFAMPDIQPFGSIGVIFGNTIMADKYITVYDRANTRIGFADMKGNRCAVEQAKGSGSDSFQGEYQSGSKGSHTFMIRTLITVAIVLAAAGVLLLAWKAFYHNPDGYAPIP
ncbi:Pepsin A [Porphyridium purpureum]|uniref:Pepsin A n=1 Tax=Porphyridium purpureum TaxID=35688 RepID=A0A5J4Z156_PORPP|nr:Pepsin A [Porphyridium purpureum]|eukprot:POR5640..scf208_2